METSVIVDADRNNFFLMVIGWEQHRRVHGFITHVQIIGEKIWIQRDGIEEGITGELVKAGVPKEQIVLGFHPPNVRQHTGYAVA
ncbi:MAG: XisI protein [Leptolyngbya sp. SIO1D8]|nr:XisI protein [Leptolyngbya sp. SIO1D8]